jgi:hypothetical protein
MPDLTHHMRQMRTLRRVIAKGLREVLPAADRRFLRGQTPIWPRRYPRVERLVDTAYTLHHRAGRSCRGYTYGPR